MGILDRIDAFTQTVKTEKENISYQKRKLKTIEADIKIIKSIMPGSCAKNENTISDWIDRAILETHSSVSPIEDLDISWAIKLEDGNSISAIIKKSYNEDEILIGINEYSCMMHELGCDITLFTDMVESENPLGIAGIMVLKQLATKHSMPLISDSYEYEGLLEQLIDVNEDEKEEDEEEAGIYEEEIYNLKSSKSFLNDLMWDKTVTYKKTVVKRILKTWEPKTSFEEYIIDCIKIYISIIESKADFSELYDYYFDDEEPVRPDLIFTISHNGISDVIDNNMNPESYEPECMPIIKCYHGKYYSPQGIGKTIAKKLQYLNCFSAPINNLTDKWRYKRTVSFRESQIKFNKWKESNYHQLSQYIKTQGLQRYMQKSQKLLKELQENLSL